MVTMKGFSTKDPNCLEKLLKATDGKIGLPFKADNWKSDKNAELVDGTGLPKEKVAKKKVTKKVKKK